MFAMSRARLVVALIVWLALAAVLALAAFSSTASANHSWSTYHWGRGAGEFTLGVDSNLTTEAWKGRLATAAGSAETSSTNGINDWSDSTQLDTQIKQLVPTTSTCPATSGRVKVCNKAYGQTGWIGLASIWTSGGHIVQGTAKMNDSYSMTAYTKQQVMCQEVGHTFGLGHQSTSGTSNFDSCMTYDKPLEDYDQWPDAHDYAQLRCIYDKDFVPTLEDRCTKRGHDDTTTTVGSASAASRMPPAAREINTADPRQRGHLVDRSANGRVEVYERDFGGGNKVITRVIRAVEATPAPEETTSGPGRSPHTHDDDDGHTHEEEGTAH